MDVLLRSRMHMPMYTCFTSLIFFLCIWIAARQLLNTALLAESELAIMLKIFSSSCTLTSFTLMQWRRLSIVLPKTELLFMSLRKFFLKSNQACLHNLVLSSMYGFFHARCSNLSTSAEAGSLLLIRIHKPSQYWHSRDVVFLITFQ